MAAVDFCLSTVEKEARKKKKKVCLDSRDVGPSRESVQVKHGSTPAVNRQSNTENPNDVHDYSCLGLVKKKKEIFKILVSKDHYQTLTFNTITFVHFFEHFCDDISNALKPKTLKDERMERKGCMIALLEKRESDNCSFGGSGGHKRRAISRISNLNRTMEFLFFFTFSKNI